MGFGFVVARFGLFLRELASAQASKALHPLGASKWVGTALIVLGVFLNILAAMQYGRFVVRYRRGEPLKPRIVSLGTVLAFVLAMLGLALAVYLIYV
jgi:putative membrane protein